MSHDLRKNDIQRWLNTRFLNTKITLSPINGDASFRRYFRTTFNNTAYIIMDSPPITEPVQPFINSTERLLASGLRVPRIHHQNNELGCLVLDDFGNTDYLSRLNHETADTLYRRAIDALITLQEKTSVQDLPVFHRRHIESELMLFSDWFLDKQCGIKKANLNTAFEYLIDACLKQAYVPMHRDYHSRNLMVLDNGGVGILDHQDIMLGPASYDLVSLIKDCYIDWPGNKVTDWLTYYLDCSSLNQSNFHQAFELTGVQRHLKAIGIFARLAHLYDKPNYLKYIPRTLKYVQHLADKEPNLRELAQTIKRL